VLELENPDLTRDPDACRAVKNEVVWVEKRMTAAFTVRRSAGGDLLRGDAGDWLVQ
jgi:hypothetical protein